MGLFRKKETICDRVWLTEVLKIEDILASIDAAQKLQRTPLVIYHFLETGSKFKSHCKHQGISFHELNSPGELDTATSTGWSSKTDVILLNSSRITRNDFKQTRRSANTGVSYSLLLLEHYPLPQRDELVLEFAKSHKEMGVPTAFVSLTEPWLKDLMGDRVLDLMNKLDVDENEVMQHQLISSSIRKAQDNLAKKVVRDFPQDSIETWLSHNLKT